MTDPSIHDLPLIDRHCVDIAAPDEEIWSALGEVLQTGLAGLGVGLIARLLGTQQRSLEGPALSPGSAIVGFRVMHSDRPRNVVLAGRHRFSRYELAFENDNGVLCAITRAEFPGLHGSAYKSFLLKTGVHVASVRRILGKVKRHAERRG